MDNEDRRRRTCVSVEADAEGVAELIGSVPGVGGIGDMLNGDSVESIVSEIVTGTADASLRAEAASAARRARESAGRKRKSGGLVSEARSEDEGRRAAALSEIASKGVPSLAKAAEVVGAPAIAASRSNAELILRRLGVDVGVTLTRKDTSDMLAALLTCSESQLEGVLLDPGVPLVLKTVVRRLCKDCRDGDTSTVERLWDRLFGKAPLADASQQQSAQSGVVPDGPVSRQAYELIRVRYFGEEAGRG